MNRANAKITGIFLERFKAFDAPTNIDIAPLTIVIGRNNSGKSSLIQALLLLKQTLASAHSDVMLSLEGMVDALSLRELTFGGGGDKSPVIEVQWESCVDVSAALSSALSPDRDNLARHSGIAWLKDPPANKTLKTALRLYTKNITGGASIDRIELQSIGEGDPVKVLIVSSPDGWIYYWRGKIASKIQVDFDHFVPYPRIDRSAVGPRIGQRAWHNAFTILFSQPLEALKDLLADAHYLGSTRQPPPSLFKVASTPPNDLGVSGEFAAQLLHRRQADTIHFLPPLEISNGDISVPKQVVALPLVDAVNLVFEALSVKAPLEIKSIQDFGFQILFGGSSASHMGRGLSFLLPIVELGLFADPLRFNKTVPSMLLAEYSEKCGAHTQIILEEPEAHLHPKVAGRLAHWLVSQALSNRRLIVETHSDHLVRRLRGLVVRAGAGSALEQWLLNNVTIIMVEQGVDGRSTISQSYLTAEGGVAEHWPADFMDEASDEESAIYYAKLSKTHPSPDQSEPIAMIEGAEPDSDVEP